MQNNILELYMKKPCTNCPFRKDSTKGWLGAARAEEIATADTFVCHKNTDKQCGGAMILNEDGNTFVRFAKFYKIDLEMKGQELIFDNIEKMKDHHGR